MKYRANIWVKLELDVEIEAATFKEAVQKVIDIYLNTAYADMDEVDADYVIKRV